jgi:glycerate dehydrogenase
VDTIAAKELGKIVTNIPAYSTTSVAQLVFALLLEHCHHVQPHSDDVMEGKWTTSQDFCFWNYPLIELSGKTMGIIGLGTIGLETARIASAFGMRILGHARNRREIDLPNFEWADLDELLQKFVVVSLHCPSTPQTEGIINSEKLSLMKKTAILINTSRGKLVNEQDLADALNTDVIRGAGLDVLSVEPPGANYPSTKRKIVLSLLTSRGLLKKLVAVY